MPRTVTDPMLKQARFVVLYTESLNSVTETQVAHRFMDT